MGQVIGLRSRGTSGAGDRSDAFDLHIASLIDDLQALLRERGQSGQGKAPRDASAAAAAAMPCKNLPTDRPAPREGDAAKRARALIRHRRRRAEFLPAALFAEPAWDMLLDLYAAHHEGKQVAVSSLCIAANVPSTTALRSIDAMARAGCLVRRRDPDDARRIFIALSETARAGLDAYFGEVHQ